MSLWSEPFINIKSITISADLETLLLLVQPRYIYSSKGYSSPFLLVWCRETTGFILKMNSGAVKIEVKRRFLRVLSSFNESGFSISIFHQHFWTSIFSILDIHLQFEALSVRKGCLFYDYKRRNFYFQLVQRFVSCVLKWFSGKVSLH